LHNYAFSALMLLVGKSFQCYDSKWLRSRVILALRGLGFHEHLPSKWTTSMTTITSKLSTSSPSSFIGCDS